MAILALVSPDRAFKFSPSFSVLTITLSVEYSHPVIIKADQTITFSVEENVITVSGADKAMVGDIAARVRAVRPPEPYKGKGIKYQGEYIRRKVGKAAKAAGAGS